jgi:hypothetical protein
VKRVSGVDPSGAGIRAAPHEQNRNVGSGKSGLQVRYATGLDTTAPFPSSKTASPAILQVGLGCTGLAALRRSQTGTFPERSMAFGFRSRWCVCDCDGQRAFQIDFASPIETNCFHSFHSASLHQL